MTAGTTVVDEIADAARLFGETTVVFHSAAEEQERTATVSELYEQARGLAAALAERGVGPGDVVAVQLPNWRECILMHSATWLLGATVLPIVAIYGPAELSFILRSSGAKAYVGPGRWRSRDCAELFEAAGEVQSVRVRVVVRRAGGSVATDEVVAMEELLEVSGADFITHTAAGPDDRALLVYTSGTTAEPKGVVHTHASLLAELRTMEQHRPGSAQRSTLAAFPAGHIAGTLGILRMLGGQAVTVLMESWDAGAAAELIARHRIESSAGAPIHLAGILEAAAERGLDVSSLIEYTTGAANVAAELIRRADAAGVRAFRCYGSTEHPTISSGSTDDPLDKRANTDGRICPGTQVRIVDDHDLDVPDGQDGEILCRGPEQFGGYTSAERNAEAFVDGWFRTGDIGRLDADGYLTITDRKKDIIVRGGENISSKEVEDALLGHPAVAEAAAVGLPDERYGECVAAFVVLRNGHMLSLDDVAQHFSTLGLARQKTPVRLEVVDGLPRTASGKVQKPALRTRVIENSGEPGGVGVGPATSG